MGCLIVSNKLNAWLYTGASEITALKN